MFQYGQASAPAAKRYVRLQMIIETIAIAGLVLLSGCGSSARHTPASGHVVLESQFCKAHVSQSAAQFQFPVLDPADADPFEWNRTRTVIDAMEYEWSFRIPKGQNFIHAGAFLFRHVNAQPATGDLSQLIASMQHSVFVQDGPLGRGTLRNDLALQVGVEDGGVIVYIDDKKTLTELFVHRPATVQFFITMPDEGNSYTCTSPIEYE